MTEAPANADILNTARMNDLASSLGESLTEVIDTYLEDAPGLIAELQSACQRADSQNIGTIAHTLKSSSGIFGAAQLMDLCRSLEQHAESDSRDSLVAQIAEEFQRVQAALMPYRK